MFRLFRVLTSENVWQTTSGVYAITVTTYQIVADVVDYKKEHG